MSQSQLADAAALSVITIVEYETSLSFAGEEADLDAIQDTLEKAGVEFTGGERPWVKLREGRK